VIEAKNIILRNMRQDDLDTYMKVRGNYHDSGEFMPGRMETPVQLKKQFEEDGFWSENDGRLIILTKENKLIGDIGFFKSIPYVEGFELGYSIFPPEERGKGYMSEAAAVFSAYMFESKPILRLQICTLKGNEPSAKVALNNGYVHEGTLKNATWLRGKTYDLEIFALYRENCLSMKDTLAKL